MSIYYGIKMRVGRILCMLLPLMLVMPAVPGIEGQNEQIEIAIEGGFGITITIKIPEGESISAINWSVEMRGPVLSGAYNGGTIIPPANETTIRILPFGIGPGMLVVNVENTSASAPFLIFGPFVVIL
ncbi:MAG: hypothetical protein DRN17_07070 [Thermoplasmata archaeon]|nr:MAG: hypothetical protein DRN17_07070 [Thermoplasmata archaeon]